MGVQVFPGLEDARSIGDTFEGDVKILDGQGYVYGDDDDITQLWDDTAALLAWNDGSDDVMTLDPAAHDLEVIAPSAGASDIPSLRLYQDRSTHTTFGFEDLGDIYFDAESSTGVRRTYAKLRSEVVINTNADEGGILQFSAMHAGTLTDYFRCLGLFAAASGGAAVEFQQNVAYTTAGLSLLIFGNQYAFRYDQLIGGIHTPSLAGMTFDVGSPDGYGLLDLAGADRVRFPVTSPATVGIIISDGLDIRVGETNGTRFPETAVQKWAAWGATPVVQPAGATQSAITDNTGGATNDTLVAISGSGDDANINDNFAELHELLHAIRTALVNSGIIKGAA